MVDYTGDKAESGVVLGKHSNGAVRIQAPGIGQRECVVSGMRLGSKLYQKLCFHAHTDIFLK